MRRALVALAVIAIAACGDAPAQFAPAAHPHRAPYASPSGAGPTADDALGPTPATGDLPNVAEPRVEDSRLACGARLLTVTRRKPLPIVSIRAVIDRGAADAPPGVAAFLARSLFTGTKRRKQVVIGQSFDEMGARRGADVLYHGLTATLEVPSANVESAVVVLADVIRNAQFPEEETERARTALVGDLDGRKGSPASLAIDGLLASVFPEGSPYHDSWAGTAATVAPRGPADLRAFHDAVFVPARTTFVVAGDFDRASLVARFDKELAGWKGEGPAPHPAPRPAPRPRGVVIYDHPGDSQASIAIGCATPGYASDEAPTLRKIASILSATRLHTTLRLAHGATYGVYANASLYRDAGLFAITGAIERDRVAESVREIFTELDRIRSDKIDVAEIAAARADTMFRMAQSFETVGEITQFLTSAAIYGTTAEEEIARWRAPRAFPMDEVRRVAMADLDPATMQVVLVGDAARLKDAPEIRALGEIRVRPMR